MHVGLDVSSLDTPHLSGVGVYITQLFKELQRLEGVQCHPVVRWSRVKKASVIKSHIHNFPSPSLAGSLLPSLQSLDLWHGPDFKLPSGKGPRKIVTIHDLAFYEAGLTSAEFAEKRIQLLENTIKQKPSAIITVSEHTKSCLLYRFPKLEIPIYAVYLGADHLGADHLTADHLGADQVGIDHVVGPKDTTKPYFLFVGNLEARKNLKMLLLAFDLFCERHSDFELVLIGRPGFGYEGIQKTLDGMKHKNNVRLLGYLSSEGLKTYYRQATAFVYPSLHEGFGIPLLEAMIMGCPILTSDRTATKEIAQGAAHLIDPEDKQALVQAMIELLDEDLRKRLIEAGLNRFKDFTWSSTAKSTAAVYASVLSSN